MTKKHKGNVLPDRELKLGMAGMDGTIVYLFCWVPSTEELAEIESLYGGKVGSYLPKRQTVKDCLARLEARQGPVVAAAWAKTAHGSCVPSPIFKTVAGQVELVAGAGSAKAALVVGADFEEIPGLLVESW